MDTTESLPPPMSGSVANAKAANAKADSGQEPNAPPKAKRRFSKAVLVVNIALCWGAVFYSIHQGQAGAVVASALALIGTLYAGYVGVGHLDMRQAVRFAINNRQETYTPPMGGPIQELPDGNL